MLVPLARRLLFQNKLRMVASLVGIGVAVLLVLQNLALYRGIQHDASVLVQRVGGDLWIVSPGTQFFELGNSMDKTVLYRVRSAPGVESAQRMNYVPAGFVCTEGNAGPINFVGVEPANTSLAGMLSQGSALRLSEAGAVIVDQSIIRKCPLKLEDQFKGQVMGEPRFHVVGFTEGLRPLTTIPYAFVSVSTMETFNPGVRDSVTFVSVRLKPSADRDAVKSAIARAVAPNEVLTREEFLERHDLYWKRTADIRIIMLITSALALFVGLLVVGQTLYSSTLEHLRQFGTLKAIGASNAFITQIVMRQAALAGLLGFCLGVVLSLPTYFVVRRLLPSEMTPLQVIAALVLVLIICVISALAPIRRVNKLEPTEVFR